MPKPVNFGGQRRTAQMYCGKVFRGHPTEVNKISAMHFRVCKECNPDGEKYEVPEFNKACASANGWGGINGKGSIGVNTQKMSIVSNHQGDEAVIRAENTNLGTVVHLDDAMTAQPLSDDMLEALFTTDKLKSVLPNKKKNKK